MLQDRLLEPLQRLARIEAELVDERRARVLVGGERVGLPARPVERQDQQLPQALAQRMLPHERLQLRHDLGRTAERQIRLQTQPERDKPQLLQAAALGARKRLVLEVRQRRAAPERKRAPQRAGRRLGVAVRKQSPPPFDQRLEPVRGREPPPRPGAGSRSGWVSMTPSPRALRSCET